MEDSSVLKRPLKITVVGDGTVGKTCLLIVYKTKEFPPVDLVVASDGRLQIQPDIPRVLDNYSGEHTVDGKFYWINLWDTAGQGECERFRPISCPKLDIVYDTDGSLQIQPQIPRVLDNNSGEHTVDENSSLMTLGEAAGQKEYERLRPLSYPQTNVFILCFALDNKDSFEKISSKWVPELKRNCPKTPIILVGTKNDIRKIPTKEGQELCKKEGLAYYVECSAKNLEGIQEVFDRAVLAAVGLTEKKKAK